MTKESARTLLEVSAGSESLLIFMKAFVKLIPKFSGVVTKLVDSIWIILCLDRGHKSVKQVECGPMQR